jgi:hypothetical protein
MQYQYTTSWASSSSSGGCSNVTLSPSSLPLQHTHILLDPMSTGRNASSSLAMASPLDLHLPQVVVGTKHISYYVAIGTILLVAWLMQSKKQKQIHAPFYKAAKMKWWFDAETLVKDSYSKVWTTTLSLLTYWAPLFFFFFSLFGWLAVKLVVAMWRGLY